MINEQIINEIEKLCTKYDDCDFSSLSTIEDGFDENEAEIICIPRFIDDYEVNYFSDDSQIHDFKEDLENFANEKNIKFDLHIIEPLDPEDYWVLTFRW